MAEIDPDALEAARFAVEKVLLQMRDDRLSVLGRGNGFVIREKDGTASDVIRLGTREGLEIGIRTYLAALAGEEAKRG